MGNFNSCFYEESPIAKLIDLRRNLLRLVEIPVTTAEIMMEYPGHVISPVTGLPNCRFSAMKADASLCRGGVYVLIQVSRVHGKVSESEMAVIRSACADRRLKRRSSRVLPVVIETSGQGVDDNPTKILGEVSDQSGTLSLSSRTRQWKPTLEPIYEGI